MSGGEIETLAEVETALLDALAWVAGMHQSASRVTRRELYRDAVAKVRARVNELERTTCTCAGVREAIQTAMADNYHASFASCPFAGRRTYRIGAGVTSLVGPTPIQQTLTVSEAPTVKP